jgi:hypothetical protein
MSDYNKDLEQKVIELQEKLESIMCDAEYNSYVLDICVGLITNFVYQETINEGKAGSQMENVVNRSIRVLINDIQEIKRNRNRTTPRFPISGGYTKLHDFINARLKSIFYKEEKMNYYGRK